MLVNSSFGVGREAEELGREDDGQRVHGEKEGKAGRAQIGNAGVRKWGGSLLFYWKERRL